MLLFFLSAVVSASSGSDPVGAVGSFGSALLSWLFFSCRLFFLLPAGGGYRVELSALLLLPVRLLSAVRLAVGSAVCLLLVEGIGWSCRLFFCFLVSSFSAVGQLSALPSLCCFAGFRVELSALVCFLFVSFVVWLYSSFVCIVYRYIFLQFKHGFLSLDFVFRAFCGFWVVYGFFIIASSPDFSRLLRLWEKFF